MILYLLVILFHIIGSMSMDNACHKKCVCMKWVRLLQCTDLNPAEYSTFTVSMLWVESAVFTTSIIDTNLLVTHVPNLKEIKLYNCIIVSCNLNGCPKLNTSAIDSTTPTTQRDVSTVEEFKLSSFKLDNIQTSTDTSDINFKYVTDFTLDKVNDNIFSGKIIKNTVLSIIGLIIIIVIIGLLGSIYMRKRGRNTQFRYEMQEMEEIYRPVSNV